MLELRLYGKTFGVKEELKADGFKWDPANKAWYKLYEESEEERVMRLSSAWEENGVYGEVISDVEAPQSRKDEKKYWVKESMIFNLESMHDKIWCLSYDIRDGKIELPFTVAGKTINDEGDLWELMDEAADLEGAAKRGKVTGKQYGRIKEITAWRVMARYTNCLAAGMDEADAALCFQDM